MLLCMVGFVECELCLLKVLEGMRRVLFCMLEVVEGGTLLLEVFEVPEVMRYVLLLYDESCGGWVQCAEMDVMRCADLYTGGSG